MGTKITSDTRALDDLITAMGDLGNRATEAAAQRAKERMQGHMYPGHGYDTGAMQASVYVQSHTGSEYGQAVAAASSISPIEFVAELDMPGQDEAHVGVAADYAGYVNNGHMTRGGGYWSGYHFVEKATDETAQELVNIVKGLLP